ncbi:unnamed protein product [Rhizophagus irregularis]|uniref:PiggyBac transposable element-derived protein domain-containing protein n=1 Tax=Rhizophagus irregularis TaxID=588596 RepID=A0A915YN37_9GLOM|nr:unnamed protein product [Rhizophagus irregularis]
MSLIVLIDCTILPEFWYSKVDPLATHIRTVSKTICIPSSNISIDEMIARFSGKSAHTVRIKNKSTPEGYKILSLCDAGYTYTFIFTFRIQTHPEIQQVSDLSKVGNEVYHLISQLPIEDKSFNIYMDNYFSSIKLFKYLREKKIGACGTVYTNSANFPKINNENENQIERVRHRPRETSTNAAKLPVRRTWMPLFFWLLDTALVNSYLILKKVNTNINHKDFRLQIVWDLIEESLKESEKKLYTRNQVDKLTNQFKFIYIDPQQYVTAKYELPIIRLFPEGHYPEWRETRSSCVWSLCCNKERSNCFKDFHTYKEDDN